MFPPITSNDIDKDVNQMASIEAIQPPVQKDKFEVPKPCKAGVKVTNLTSQRQLSDSLHHKAKKSHCPANYCKGSLMSNDVVSKPNKRTNQETLEMAIEFLTEYFIHLKKNSTDEMTDRFNEMEREVEASGTYTLTAEELAFGAKTAWRNASRCINRIQWNNLHCFDARHVKNTKDMFDALCRHIEFASNDGNVRSVITIFPQRVTGREDFRVWNPQMISYAGYLQADGSVVGDPARVVLTRICERLGWKGKGGYFDVLPLVMSAPGDGVHYYDVPDSIILRIKLEHPTLPWFKDLGLEWYALPAVSDMLFDVGGVEFPAAPFNGWYMGTEIGSRDLLDEQRYNLSRKLGEMMGLDCESPTSLWKDAVNLETNKAVLYSFAKNKVTIVDHHTASQSFIQHMSNENKVRGGCPADWVWIVPPMSGSLTNVFHQEMVNYHLKPSYEYQAQAWKGYSFKKVELRIKFSSASKAILCCVRLMSTVLSKRVKATVLFATETGRAETFALKLAHILANSYNVQVIKMDDYVFDELKSERLLFVVASTFGNGDPPDNGKTFWKALYTVWRQKNATPLDLSDLTFSVFGLGSSLYPTFGAFGKNVDKVLKQLSAKPIRPVIVGDELKGQEKLFDVWCQAVVSKSLKLFGLWSGQDGDDSEDEIMVSDKEAFVDEVFDSPRYRLKRVNSKECANEHTVITSLARIHGDKRYPAIFPLQVISRQHLQPRNNIFNKQSFLVRLSPSNPLASAKLAYKPGDHLGVFPSNPPALVGALLGRLTSSRKSFAEVEDAALQVEYRDDTDEWITQARLPPCSLREAFTNYRDIASPPGQRFLASMSVMANDRGDSLRLKKLSQEPDEYRKWRTFNLPNMLDVLNEFPSVHITPEFLMSCLPLLAPRLYSISSSLEANPDEVHLTMSLVSFSTHHDPAGPQKRGVCTSFFDRFPESPVPCFVRPAPGFRLPEDLSRPVIMIGAGSGIAPFRSFWQEREVVSREKTNDQVIGKMILFFGCRSEKVDYLYQGELTDLLKSGILHEVYLAQSRDDRHRKRYVQDEVYTQRALIHWLLEHEMGHIFVCGDAQMADGVRKSLVKVFETEGGLDEVEAQNSVDDLLNQNRYHEDVFGAKQSFYLAQDGY